MATIYHGNTIASEKYYKYSWTLFVKGMGF